MIKVFFAHPDAKLVQLYQPHLSRYFAFDSAHDGLTALRKIRLTLPNVIISDYALPQLSGLGLLKFVRAERSLSHTPFLFLADSGDMAEALSFGANEFLIRRSAPPSELIDKIYYHIKHGIQIH